MLVLMQPVERAAVYAVPEKPDPQPRSLYDFLTLHAARTPERPAIVRTDGAAISYAETVRLVRAICAHLSPFGDIRGARVGLIAGGGVQGALALIATSSSLAAAPLDAGSAAEEYLDQFRRLGLHGLVIASDIDSAARGVALELELPVVELPSGNASFGSDAVPSNHGIGLILQTSGTTSKPKVVPFTQEKLCTTALMFIDALGLSSEDRCLNFMRLTHAHGINALFASLVAGGSVTCAAPFDADRFFYWLSAVQPTWFTAVPSIHEQIVSWIDGAGANVDLSRLRFIRSASSTLPDKVLHDLERLFEVPVLQTYGLTEAGIVAATASDFGKRGSVGTAVLRAEIAIVDERGRTLGSNETGAVVVRAADLVESYEDAEQTREAFVEGWFHTGDQGYLDGDGALFLTGRLKELISRGGEKISPFEVEAALFGHPDVLAAVAFAVPHLRLEEDVAAAVVLRAGAAVTPTELRIDVAQRLGAQKVPYQVIVVPEIPKTSNGKIVRRNLARHFGLDEVSRRDVVLPTNLLQAQLLEIWEDLLGLRPIGIRDNFFELGGHSLLAMRMIARVQKTCGKLIPISEMLVGPTIEHLEFVLSRDDDGLGAAASIVPVNDRGAKVPFYFLHGDVINGGSYCRELSRLIGEDRPFHAVVPHGMNGASVPPSVEAMAEEIASSISAVAKPPYLLGGNCAGGTIAFETARRLHERGNPPDLVVLIGCQAKSARFRRLAALVGLLRVVGVPESLRRRLFRALRRCARFAQHPHIPHFGGGSAGTENEIDAAVATFEVQRRALYQLNGEITTSYVPKAYNGAVALLKTDVKGDEVQNQQTWDWDLVAPNLTVCDVGSLSDGFAEFHRTVAARLNDLFSKSSGV